MDVTHVIRLGWYHRSEAGTFQRNIAPRLLGRLPTVFLNF